MYCKPYKNAKPSHITQIFGANPQYYHPIGHPGIDWGSKYGTFLVAPCDGTVHNIITDANIYDEYYNKLTGGYGITIKEDNSDRYHMYWHCLQVFPVGLGQKVKQGQPIAQMGNSGFVVSGGQVVPIEIRNTPPYYGTHLHQEIYRLKSDGKKDYLNPQYLIDFSIPVKYDIITTIKSILTNMTNLFKGR